MLKDEKNIYGYPNLSKRKLRDFSNVVQINPVRTSNQEKLRAYRAALTIVCKMLCNGKSSGGGGRGKRV